MSKFETHSLQTEERQELDTIIAALEKVDTNPKISQSCHFAHERVNKTESMGGSVRLCAECPRNIQRERIGCAHDSSIRDILKRGAIFLNYYKQVDVGEGGLVAELYTLSKEISHLDATVRELNVLIYQEEVDGEKQTYIFDPEYRWRDIPEDLAGKKQLLQEAIARHDEIIQRLLAMKDELLTQLRTIAI